MSLSYIAGIGSILAGFAAVLVGLYRGELTLLTFGAGLLGAPGFTQAVTKEKQQ